jgi:hypothetical protein
MDAAVAPTVLALLEALHPTPAFVLDPTGDVLAWNPAWAATVRSLGLLDTAPDRTPNLVRFVFADPAARSVFPEWRLAADEQAGRLRRAHALWSHEARVGALVDELGGDPEFAARWNAHPVDEKRRGPQRITHPDVGDLDLAFEVLDLADDGGQQLVSWLPADELTATRLATLAGAGRLRLVEGA